MDGQMGEGGGEREERKSWRSKFTLASHDVILISCHVTLWSTRIKMKIPARFVCPLSTLPLHPPSLPPPPLYPPLSPSLSLPCSAGRGGANRVRILSGCRGFSLSFLVVTVLEDVCVSAGV